MKKRHHPAAFGRALSSLALGLTLLFSFSAPAAAQTDEHPMIEKLKQRWAEKTEEEKSVLMERFQRLQELPSEDRELFLDRAKRLGKEKRRWLKKHRDGDFERELERRARGQRRFPKRLLERLERSPRERRPVLLERHLRELRGNGKSLERLGRRLELNERQLEELRTMGEGQRVRRVLELRRRFVEKGLDPSRKDMRELRRLSDEGFFERLREIRSRRRPGREGGREGRGPKPSEDV